MKKILITLTLIIALFSCSVDKHLLTKEESAKWSVKGDTIYYSQKAVAIYDHYEYELNPSHGKHADAIVELSIAQITHNVSTADLIKYIHSIHSKQKVEIVVPRGPKTN